MENQTTCITMFPQGKYDNLRPQVQPVKATYAEMVEMRSLGKLIPGQCYRIIDYVTTVNSNLFDNARSAGHPFDILVMAESETVLQEQASAIQHAGDTYFANSRLEAWELKYRLDNVQWSLQKGTYMKSDMDGDSYGFKKLGTIVLDGTTYVLWQGDAMFVEDWGAYAVSENEEIGSTLYAYYGDPEDFSPDDEVGVIDTVTIETNEGKGTIVYMKDEFNNECTYDFKNVQFKRYMTTDSVSGRQGLGGLYMVADTNNVPQGLSVDDDTDFIWAFTFSSDNSGGEQTDYSLGGQDVYSNTINEMGNGTLNNIVFFGKECHSMSFGSNNYSMSFGGNNYDISFGHYNFGMSFGNANRNICFGDYSHGTSFGKECHSISLGNVNSIMSFGTSNSKMSFGNANAGMSFGNNNAGMSFGNNNFSISFGDSCKNVTITEGVSYVDIAANTWNIQLLNGLEGTYSSHLTPPFATSKAYTQVACKNSSGQLEVYVPGDLA